VETSNLNAVPRHSFFDRKGKRNSTWVQLST